MRKGAEAFRSIGEVAKLIGVAPHVLRYWETQFTLLKPMKRPDGRRYYRPDDVRLAAGLYELLRDEGLTIRGARKLLSRDRGESVRALGTTRLGELLGSQIETGPETVLVSEATPAPVSVPGADPRPADPVESGHHPVAGEPRLGHQAAAVAGAITLADDPFTSADADFAEEAEEMPHGPRSRQRRRRGPSDHGLLPLFPDMALPEQSPQPDRGDAEYPREGMTVVVALQAMDRLPPQMVVPAEKLLAAMRALDGISAPR